MCVCVRVCVCRFGVYELKAILLCACINAVVNMVIGIARYF